MPHIALVSTFDALALDEDMPPLVAALVREAFFDVVNRLVATQGGDPVAWRWGAVQRVWLGTPLGGRHGIALLTPRCRRAWTCAAASGPARRPTRGSGRRSSTGAS